MKKIHYELTQCYEQRKIPTSLSVTLGNLKNLVFIYKVIGRIISVDEAS